MAAIWLVAPMVTSTLFRFYSYNYTAVQNYYKKTAYVASGTVIAMFVNVGLNYVCILLFGYQAAAYTTAASYIFLLILQGWQEMRITGQRIIPLKTTLKYAFVFLAANLITMGSYLLPWYLRYLVALTGILYASYKILPEFMGILKSVRQKH